MVFGGAVAVGGISGGIAGGWKGALFGAITGGLMWQVGQFYNGMYSDAAQKALQYTDPFIETARAMSHGVVGGTMSELQGGKFAAGFFAASFSSAANSILNARFPDISPTGRVVAAGVVGGTGSVLGGGKFMNGAATAVFETLFNALSENLVSKMDRRIVEQGIAIVPAMQSADWAERVDNYVKLASESIALTGGILSVSGTPVTGGLEAILGFGLEGLLPGADVDKIFNYAGRVIKDASLSTRPVDIYSVVKYQDRESFLFFFKRWGEVQTNTQLIVNPSIAFRGWAGSSVMQFSNNKSFLAAYEKTLKNQMQQILGNNK